MSGEGDTTIQGRTVDWMELEEEPGKIGVWIDEANPIGNVWMSQNETWFCEAWFGPGYAIAEECETFEEAVEALANYAIEHEKQQR